MTDLLREWCEDDLILYDAVRDDALWVETWWKLRRLDTWFQVRKYSVILLSVVAFVIGS